MWAFIGAGRAADLPRAAYYVPIDTLLATDAATLGIRNEADIFGGVVAQGFTATKAITHSLVSADAARPEGWSEQFPRRAAHIALPGFTAFARPDAEIAATELLKLGDVRVKPVSAKGGGGQVVISELEGLKDIADEMITSGIVLEENLSEVSTFSVGQVRVAELVISYFGTQRLTKDNTGGEVYGGSDLTVIRGELRDLEDLGLPERIRLAVGQARLYDAAATECLPGFFASRRNYDVLQGRNRAGVACSGVLEQSWRIGGASTAEIVALEAFRADPRLRKVRAASCEIYGDEARAPEGGQIFHQGRDPAAGPLLKYAVLERL